MSKYQKIVIAVFFALMVCALLFPPFIIASEGTVAQRTWRFLFYSPRGYDGALDIATLSVELLLVGARQRIDNVMIFYQLGRVAL